MKILSRILKVIGLLLAILAIYVTVSLAWGIYRYTDGTPKITPYEGVRITVGQTVTPDELALIERSHGTKITDVRWVSGDIMEIEIAEDGSSFTVNEGTGTLQVSIDAQHGDSGENAYEAVIVICDK